MYLYIYISISIYIYLKTYFFNGSFIPAGEIRIFVLVETVFFYLQLFFFLRKPLLALKSVSTSRNEGCSWNIVSTGLKKKTITSRSVWKIEKKIVSTWQKINCPLAIISSFFENCLPLILIMASTSRKIVLIKEHCFHQTENPFSLAGWRNFWKTCFYYTEKLLSL